MAGFPCFYLTNQLANQQFALTRCLSNSFDDFRRTLKTVLFARY